MNTPVPDFNVATYASPSDSSMAASQEEQTRPQNHAALLGRAILLGIGGAVLGAVLYGGFIHLTHLNVGYLSIVVAYLVAKAMTLGSKGRGGRAFQVSAILLTCLAVAMGNSLMAYWSLRAEGPLSLSFHHLLRLLGFGLMEPVFEFHDSPANALLSLFILFVGLRMTSGVPGAMRHPFSRGF